MDAIALPFVVFAVFLGWLLVELIRGSIEDPYPRRAGVTWAITCPLAGLLFGVGLAPIALVSAVISILALGSLAYWFLATASDDSDEQTGARVEPDPGPSDDLHVEIPAWALRAQEPEPKSDVDWDAFDRLREEWEKEFTIPATEPERELVPAGD